MKRKNGMSTDYERGYKQFAEMVGEENIELHEIFEAIFQVAAYAGFAAAWDALEKLGTVLSLAILLGFADSKKNGLARRLG